MYQVSCAGCGEKVTVTSFLAAAGQSCPACGRPLVDDGSRAADRMARAFAGGAEPEPRPKRLAKQYEQRAMVVGGLIGAFVMMAVGALGGPVGRPIVGAAGGALVGVLLGAIGGAVRGAAWGLRMGDSSWVNFWVMLEAAGGLFLGTLVGLHLKQLTLFTFSAGVLGGAVLGVIAGTVIGGVMGLKAERQAAAAGPELAESTT